VDVHSFTLAATLGPSSELPGFLASEFISLYSQGLLVSCSNFDLWSQLCLFNDSSQRPFAIGRAESAIHSLHEPAYNFEPRSPAYSIANRFAHAVIPDPH